MGEDYTQGCNIGCRNEEVVETISDVYLDYVGRTIASVDPLDFVEDMLEGSAELHCFSGGQWECVLIDTIELKIYDDTQMPITLGMTPSGDRCR